MATIHKLDIHKQYCQSAGDLLRSKAAEADEGYLRTCMIIYTTTDGHWGTASSKTDNNRAEAAMLMELAMRKLS